MGTAVPTFPWIFALAFVCTTYGQGELPCHKVRESLDDLTKNGLGVSAFQDYLNANGQFTGRKLDGKATATELATLMSATLVARSSMLKSVKKKLEDNYDSYRAVTEFQECCKLAEGQTVYTENFRAPVDKETFCMSVSQYANFESMKHMGKDILKLWKSNLVMTPDVKWQYVGTVDGVSYVFPAAAAPDCGGYDPRRRPWFAAAMSFRKAVIFVIDVSTGMVQCKVDSTPCMNITWDIMSVLLDTLTSRDFIGLVTFDEEYSMIEDLNGDPCIKHNMAVASDRNKDALKNYIMNIRFRKNVDSIYSAGIEGVEEYLIEKEDEAHYQVIFITGTSNTESMLSTKSAVFNSLKAMGDAGTLVLIPYFLGSATPQQKSVLEDMVEGVGRGTVIEIIEPDDVYKTISKYFKAIAHKETSKYVITQSYFDANGLGLITTVCKAMFSEQSSELIGVIAYDIPISGILSDAVEYEKSDSYVFVIDIYGLTLAHPLLPKPSEISSKFVDITIDLLEGNAQLSSKVFSKMRKQEDGDVQLKVPVVIPKGFQREGTTVVMKEMSYNFRKVEDTTISLCVVSVIGDDVTSYDMKKELSNHELSFLYHDATLQNANQEFCNWFNRKAVQTASGVKFAPRAFNNPGKYSDEEEEAANVQEMERIIRGESSDDMLADDVRISVHLTDFLNDLWVKSSSDATYAGWRYMGTERGLFRIFPGVKLAKNFEPSTRAWYLRGIHAQGNTSVSAPYKDAMGSGYTITISQAVFEGGDQGQKAFGVMAMDLSVQYFYLKVLKDLADCSGDYVCFLIDTSGFIIVHPSWFSGKWEGVPNYEMVHITQKEWDIAAHMIDYDYMKKGQCVDWQLTKEQHFYEIVVDAADHLDEKPYYDYKIVPKTNMYIVRKNIAKVGNSKRDDVCACAADNVIEDCVDLSEPCVCPCRASPNDIDSCSGTVLSDLYLPCYPKETAATDNEDNSKEEAEELSMCFEQDCSTKVNELDCVAVMTCQWCQWKGRGVALTEPYCGRFHECYHGMVDLDSPFSAMQIDNRGSHICSAHTSVILLILITIWCLC